MASPRRGSRRSCAAGGALPPPLAHRLGSLLARYQASRRTTHADESSIAGRKVVKTACAQDAVCVRQALMPPIRLLQLVFLLAAASAAATVSAQAPRLPTAQLTSGIHLITAEVAANDAARGRGLMFRQGLLPNHGMLFVFENKSVHCMWLRNTLIPLSVAFVEDDGTIVNIEDMKPHDESRHCAKQPVRYALEMTEGWFAQKGIRPGMKLGRLPAAQK
jgi:uncharacterized membrane protein (UPF0127 family)